MALQHLYKCDEVDALIDGEALALIYKHSAACPISARTTKIIERFAEAHPDIPVADLKIQGHRDISEHIAQRTGVTHQSPQVIFVRAGEAVWHTSHMKITGFAMDEALKEAGEQETERRREDVSLRPRRVAGGALGAVGDLKSIRDSAPLRPLRFRPIYSPRSGSSSQAGTQAAMPSSRRVIGFS